MKNLLILIALLTFFATSVSALASGQSPRGGAGDGWGTDVRAGKNSRISKQDRLIRIGRARVRRHVTCDGCKYNNNLTRRNVAEVSKAVRAGHFNIKEKDRKAVLFYLNYRYGG